MASEPCAEGAARGAHATPSEMVLATLRGRFSRSRRLRLMRCPSAGVSARVIWGLCGSLPAIIACGEVGPYVWVTDLPAQVVQGQDDYLIREGDLISIRVFNQEPLSTRARVRSDGRISVPVVGDIDVRGKRPSAVKAELEKGALNDYVKAPSVTVTVEESQPISVAVLGEVTRQGVFPVESRATVANVVALAGGINDFASRDRIFVVRRDPQPLRVRFTYDALRRGEPHAASFVLHQGDMIVVE
jgi:polysaccharide export outer membrane protein